MNGLLLGRVALRPLSLVDRTELCQMTDDKPWPGFSYCYQGGNKAKTGSEWNQLWFCFACRCRQERKGILFSEKVPMFLIKSWFWVDGGSMTTKLTFPVHCESVAALTCPAESCSGWLPSPLSRAGPDPSCEKCTVHMMPEFPFFVSRYITTLSWEI